ncbi:YafY family protein [Telmatospirillum sp. J64-1]|uniref:helix-turn-helix transcriptional regulator n=1 Tax=Telmatospirillum sp. J64-1 TaxID=2502183 RepID=UPI00115E1A28|nr:WYL domain-containing protein [Telmatospirillum sp. J64-1]
MTGEILRRRAFIQLMAHWFGEVKAADIQQAFGLSQAQAYRCLAAMNTPLSEEGAGSADMMLAHLRAQSLSNHAWKDLGLDFRVSVEDADLLTERRVQAHILRVLLPALQKRRAVLIAYTGRKGVSERIISPAHLVHVQSRYHLRAWDHTARKHKDFVLSRITETEPASECFTYPHDPDWAAFILLRFKVNPALPAALRAALAQEWELTKDGIRECRCRKALSRYVVRRMTEQTSLGPRRWLPADETTQSLCDQIASQQEAG